jgi:serine/threonine protein kinase
VKLENIMFANNKPGAEVKIIDFGLATKYLSDDYKRMTDRVGTVYTMAPQVTNISNLNCRL